MLAPKNVIYFYIYDLVYRKDRKINLKVNHKILTKYLEDLLDHLYRGIVLTFNFHVPSMPNLSDPSVLVTSHSNRKC